MKIKLKQHMKINLLPNPCIEGVTGNLFTFPNKYFFIGTPNLDSSE